MTYSLDPREVKKVIDAKLSGKPYNEQQFMFYHLHRNHFNVKGDITTLTKVGFMKYKDNHGNLWQELPAVMNKYHMPEETSIMRITLGIDKPYSRKFIRPDNLSGVGGEFEMVIRQDGKRIDYFTSRKMQETYNFGRTMDLSKHYTLDMATHSANGNYTCRTSTGKVNIIEK